VVTSQALVAHSSIHRWGRSWTFGGPELAVRDRVVGSNEGTLSFPLSARLLPRPETGRTGCSRVSKTKPGREGGRT
jgi:hypothetical protein